MKHSLFFAALTLISTAAAQASGVTPPPFKAGETLHYVAKWKNTVTAGRLKATVAKLDLKTGKVDIKATVRSGLALKIAYPISYEVTSSMDLNTLSSTRFSLIGREAKEQKKQIETFDYANHKGYLDFAVMKKGAKEPKKSKRPPEYALHQNVNDVLSLLYYIRAAKLPTSAGSVTVPIIYEAEKWNSTIKFVGKTTAWVDGTSYPAIEYQMINVSETGETNSNTRFVIAQDAAKTLTFVESEVEVGKVQLKLTGVSSAEGEEEEEE